MRLRQFPSMRSEINIRDKLKALKKTLPNLLNQNKEWEQSAVDAQIASYQFKRSVQELLMYGSQEKNETFTVSAPSPNLLVVILTFIQINEASVSFKPFNLTETQLDYLKDNESHKEDIYECRLSFCGFSEQSAHTSTVSISLLSHSELNAVYGAYKER